MGFLLSHGDPLMVDHTPSSAVTAGDVVVKLGRACIAHTDIPADTLGAVAWPNGRAVYVIDDPGLTYREGEETFSAGATLYVESDGETFSDTSTSNFAVGVCMDADAGNGDRILHGG